MLTSTASIQYTYTNKSDDTMNAHPLSRTFLLLLLALGLAVFSASSARAQSAPPLGTGYKAIEVTATDYAFRAPKEIPSGWTTIRFKNDGKEQHFVFMSRLPEGKTIDDYETDLGEPYSEAWNAILTGKADQAEAMQMLGEKLPEWFPAIQFAGGPGFLAPGHQFETTLHLEPGNYVIECYMKTEDGKIHAMDGMLRPLTVTEAESGTSEPDSDVRVTLSNTEMAVDGELAPGRQTIAVHVAENPEQGFGHSAHLARLDDNTSVDEVVQWMNWFDLNGLRAPAPAEFIGGAHMMPTGNRAYFTADLTPGRYLFISEATAPQGMYHEFTVAP